jgi:hypothetical protein
MAANEHKNLTDVNRHLPKGFETATNETVLSKDIGTDATLADGNLEWQAKSNMGVTNHKMQGYVTTSLTNYVYGEDVGDSRSPYQMDSDYGNSVVASGTIDPSNVFRIGQGIIIPEASSVSSIKGWVTSNGGYVVTVAICKVTPAVGVTTALVPTVIDEITATGLTNNNKLVAIGETTITSASLLAGDIIFPMIKEATAGSTIYMNLTIQTTTY